MADGALGRAVPRMWARLITGRCDLLTSARVLATASGRASSAISADARRPGGGPQTPARRTYLSVAPEQSATCGCNSAQCYVTSLCL